MAAALLDRAAMIDVLKRWGYVDPDAILLTVARDGHWSDQVSKHTKRTIVKDGPSDWFVMFVS